MKEESLYDFHLGLIPNLVTELYFYLPKDRINQNIVEKIDLLKDSSVYNKVLVLDYHKGPIYYNKDRSLKEIVLVEGRIEKNIFQLLEKKSEISEDQFKYILDKYFEYVDSMLYCAEWMYKNLNNFISCDVKLKNIFFIQFRRFEKHFNALVQTFYINKTIPKANYNTSRIWEIFIPKSKSSLLEKHHKIENKANEKTSGFNKNQQDVVKYEFENPKKKPLISEQEAKKILLKKFFGINIKD